MDIEEHNPKSTGGSGLAPEVEFRVRGLKHMVGNSPLLAIACTYRGKPRMVYAKAEHLNMTGSIKDRMALHILSQGYARGRLEPGAWIVEATSGNTGISVAGIGRAMGHPVKIFMPDWMSLERIDLIRSAFGGQWTICTQGDDSWQCPSVPTGLPGTAIFCLV